MNEKYITFSEYVRLVVANQPARSEELQILIKLHGVEFIDKILNGEDKDWSF